MGVAGEFRVTFRLLDGANSRAVIGLSIGTPLLNYLTQRRRGAESAEELRFAVSAPGATSRDSL